jgi:hypothetical protein
LTVLPGAAIGEGQRIKRAMEPPISARAVIGVTGVVIVKRQPVLAGLNV